MPEHPQDILIAETMTPTQQKSLESAIVTAKQTIWQRIWASWTMAWAAILMGAGIFLDVLPFLLDLLGTPEWKEVITYYTGPYASHVFKAIAAITVAARLKGLMK